VPVVERGGQDPALDGAGGVGEPLVGSEADLVPASGSIARSVQRRSLADGGGSERSKIEGVRGAFIAAA
jgi:hypothetical protein